MLLRSYDVQPSLMKFTIHDLRVLAQCSYSTHPQQSDRGAVTFTTLVRIAECPSV
jgi:hypothetical protein